MQVAVSNPFFYRITKNTLRKFGIFFAINVQTTKFMKSYLLLLGMLTAFSFNSNAQYWYKGYPKFHFDAQPHAPNPDYSNTDHWAALPGRQDAADNTPKGFTDRQKEAQVDVFFVHPTTYNGNKGMDQWNADVNDPELNKKTDETTIKYQSSVFNGSGRVYAPRYRQAHIHSYYNTDPAFKKDTEQALNLAYQDVKKAFQHYMEHYNNGRPFIIASHSQGTTHTSRLLSELFDDTDLKNQLVAAYVIGMPVDKDKVTTIPVCETPEQTTCYCTWRTYKKGFFPEWDTKENNYEVTNPLTWTTDKGYAPDDLNKGAVLKNFSKVRPEACDAQIVDGVLWINQPNILGAKLMNLKNWHIGDINLFYANIRENLEQRIATFFEAKNSVNVR